MGARWVGSWALVLAAVSVRSRHVLAQSQGYPPPGSERPASRGSAFPRAGCWGALVSGEGCGQAAPGWARWAVP